MSETGVNQDRLQYINRNLILRILRGRGMCTRAELSRESHLRPATLTNIINEFLEQGLVLEEGVVKEGRGRSGIGVKINAEAFDIIGIRFERKVLKIGLYDFLGEKIEDELIEINEQISQEKLILLLQENVRKYLSLSKRKVLGIGCAVPGPFLKEKGRIALLTEFYNWKDISIQENLEIFNIPVYVEHGANVGALSCYWELGGECQSLLYVSAGQGVGAGMLSEGQLISGKLGTAGEMGHMSISYNGPFCACGNRGCLELYCSTLALKKNITKKRNEGNYTLLEEDFDVPEIKEAIKNQDPLAVEEYKKVIEMLSIGIVNMINSFNPEIIVIEDELPEINPQVFERVMLESLKGKVIQPLFEHTRIQVGEHAMDHIIKGACLLAAEEIFS